MTAVFKSPGVYTSEADTSGYWLPPELVKGLRQYGLSMSRRAKIAKIFKEESLCPTIDTEGPVGPVGPIGLSGLPGKPGRPT